MHILSFSDFYLMEAAAAPTKINGLTVIPLSTFVQSDSLQEADPEPFLGAKTRTMSEPEMQDYLGRIKTGSKTKQDKFQNPFVHASSIEIKNEQDQTYDQEKLRAAITKRPKALLAQNEKMQHSDGSFSVFFNLGLPALKGLAVNEKTNEFVVVDTCPGAGTCKTYCYAMAGGYIRYKETSAAQSRKLNFLLNDPKGFADALKKEIAAAAKRFDKKDTQVIIRWHDAGDFFSPQYLALAYSVAEAFPKVKFYAYTKMANVATDTTRPDNFVMNFSQGAAPSQEKNIDFTKTKNSRVVPKELFVDLYKRKGIGMDRGKDGKSQLTSPEALIKLKQRLAQKYSLDINSLLTYDEMMAKPVGSSPKWNVIVAPGDGDDSAQRADVMSTLLLIH